MRAALVGLALLLAAATPVRAAEDTVANLVFAPGRFLDFQAPAVLRYRFLVHGINQQDRVEPVRVEVGAAGADGSKPVHFEMFTGAAQRTFGPIAAREQNPVLIAILQMDVEEMGKLTGGAPAYFQRRIREAFTVPSPAEDVTVELAGKTVAAKRITIRPFANDPNIARFPVFRDKAYVMTVSDEVPGGLWELATVTPDPQSKTTILAKTLTFEGVDRPVVPSSSGG